MKILAWGIYLIVFCLPLYLVRFKIFGIPTTVLELMIYTLFIGWGIKFILKRDTNYEWHTNLRIIIPIILIFAGVSLATIFSSDLRTSAGIWKAWFIDPILFFIVLISVIKNSEQIKKTLFSLFLSGTVVSIISLIYLIFGKLDPTGRLEAFYTSPNYLAMYLAPAFLTGLGYYFFTFLVRPSEADSGIRPRSSDLGRTPCPLGLITRKKTISQILIFVFLFFILCSLFSAHSYGAWLGIIAAIGLGLVLYCLKLKKRELAVLVLCLFILAALFLGYFALNFRAASLNARLIIWQKAWEIFKINPILGIGPGTFGNYLQPHNIFLAFLLQAGIIGFIGFILLIIWFFRHKADQPRAGNLQLLLMMIMTYILVHGLVDTTYWKNDLAVIFWTTIGLMAVIRSQVNGSNFKSIFRSDRIERLTD